jgi:hypothetical protein
MAAATSKKVPSVPPVGFMLVSPTRSGVLLPFVTLPPHVD